MEHRSDCCGAKLVWKPELTGKSRHFNKCSECGKACKVIDYAGTSYDAWVHDPDMGDR